MSLIFLLIFIFLIKLLSFSSPSENFILQFQNLKRIDPIKNFNNYLLDDDEGEKASEYFQKLMECYQNYSNFTDRTFYLGKCLINITLENEEGLHQLLKLDYIYTSIIGLINGIDPTGRIKNVISFVQKSAKSGGELIEYIHLSLSLRDSYGFYLLDYMYDMIDDIQNRKLNHIYIFRNISYLFKNYELDNIYEYIKNEDPQVLADILYLLISKTPNFYDIYELIQNNSVVDKYEIIYFIIDVLRNFIDVAETFRTVGNFLENNPQSFDFIKSLIRNPKFSSLFKELMHNNDDILNAISDTIIDNQEVLDLFFEIISHTELIKNGVEILINVQKIEYLTQYLPTFLKNISKINNNYITRIWKSIMYVAGNLHGKKKYLNIVSKQIKAAFLTLLNDQGFDSFNITKNCKFLFYNTFFNDDSSWNNVYLLYLKKFLFDSPRNKGDFLSFDYCMEIKNENSQNNIDYHVEPSFVIGIIDDPKNKFTFKNTTFFEKYYYITNYCLPFGYKNNGDLSKENVMCDINEYNKFLRFFNSLFSNATRESKTFETIVLNKKNIELSDSDNIIGFFSILILIIPILVKIYLMIGKCIVNRKNKNFEKLNKLIVSDKNGKKDPENEQSREEHILRNKKELSKCQKLLNEYFDFIKNGSELFNFNLNNTNFNNVNGITYIKGLMGISIILTVFGLTYIILVNIPMKEYGSWHFHKSIKSWIYFLVFIGYRYSPRVLFSCSGYTLIYKYLCYIEQEQGLYFLKFVFLQSYKYILLYLVLLLFRFSIHKIIYFIHQLKRPSWMLFEHYLEQEKNFLIRSFTLLFNLNGDDIGNDKTRQNLIFNFYIPINEVFFFIVGTMLISLGYKYKLRLDFIILGIIFIFFIIKVILYSVHFYKEEKMYTTTDYYLFDLGIHFLNPLYNLTFFFIGMYFGLINYSIQKGINDIYENNNYKKYIPLKESKNYMQNQPESDINLSPLKINSDDNSSNSEEEKIKKENDINKNSNEKIEKLMTTEEVNKGNDKEIKEYNDQIKKMPFLISPIQFFRINMEKKDKLWYNLLIFFAVIIMIFLCLTKSIFIRIFSSLNEESSNEEYMSELSLEKTISSEFLNILYIFDMEIVVFLSQWIIFILFFKEATLIRSFCNSIYWSFFVKTYYPFTLISVPVILIIFYESESVIKIHIYNFILYSLINLIFIILFVIIFYSVYDLPFKKLFKYFIKGSEIIEEEDEEDSDEEEEKEKEEDELEIEDGEEEGEEMKSLKS